ncbi:MAG TPA: hypothetical protein VEQ11_16050 [Chloroflexota bacterium]|nr:hypothetical protein [Chloroflexota bacterium]
MSEETFRDRLYDLPRLLDLRAALRRVSDPREPRAELVSGANPSRAARPGVLPGSFNPLTTAHTGLAEAALANGSVDVLLFALSTHTVDKEVVTGAALEDRLLVLQLYAERDQRLGVLLLNRGLYVDQAALIRMVIADVQTVVFVVGFDKIVQIFDPHYYDDRDAALERLFSIATFLVAPRGAGGAEQLAELLTRAENRHFASAVRLLDVPPELSDIGSSQVRQAIQAGQLPGGQLPPEAQALVEETGAYAARGPEEGGVDRYRLRLALLDALEVTLGPAAGADTFRELYRKALAEPGPLGPRQPGPP